MLLVITVLVAMGSAVKAQLVKQKTKVGEKQTDRDWYNCSPEQDQVYGACVNQAYEFLKDKKPKARPIVALIGNGIDTEHEALKDNLWKNPKEKPDGKDNDKNGYVDDVYGWNFLGGKEGQMMPYVTREGEREFFRLRDKYADIIKDGSKYYTYVDGKRKDLPAPEDPAEHHYYRFQILKESRLANTYGSIKMVYVGRDYAELFDREIREKFPDRENFSIREIAENCASTTPKDSTLRNFYLYAMQLGAGMTKDTSWNSIRDRYLQTDKRVAEGVKKYERTFEKYGNDRRKEIVGDDYMDINDRVYGNNVLLTSEAMIGTMQAGVIAGKRGVEGRNNPIAGQAEVMTLVVQAGEGEPYLKDMALAIRYAVDHKASVIVLPQQNSFYPETQKQWMIDAIRYAEEKGVLVIVPTWEMAMDLQETPFYPHRWMDGEKELTNLLVTGVSDRDGMPSAESNFGQTLDLFAPGKQVLSACTGDTYQFGTGSSMASSIVAGVAALIKTYYPKLTGSQIRDILMNTVTSRKGVEVEKNVRKGQGRQVDLYLFEQLCKSAGIVNACEAVKAADRMNGNH